MNMAHTYMYMHTGTNKNKNQSLKKTTEREIGGKTGDVSLALSERERGRLVITLEDLRKGEQIN